MDLVRSFRRRPLRGSLLLLQVVFGTLLMTLALSAFLNSRQGKAEPERFNIISGYSTDSGSMTYTLFYARDVPQLLKLAPAVEKLAVVSEIWDPSVIVGNTRYEFRRGAKVGATFFDLEPPEIVRGSALTKEEASGQDQVALLSDDAARAIFGDAYPIGQTMNLETDDFRDDTPPALPTPYRIVGTFSLESTNRFSESSPLYIPVAADRNTEQASVLVVRARAGQSDVAKTQLLSALRQIYKDELEENGTAEGQDFMIRAPGESTFGSNDIDQDLLTFGLFGAVALIVSSIGIFSATLVETEERSHEIGVRRALGASTARIGRSLVGRSLVIALIGGVIGIVGAALLIPLLREPAQSVALFGGTDLTFEPLAALVALCLVALLSGLLGLIPAFQIGRLKPIQVLRESP